MESLASLAATADPYEVDVTLSGCDSSDPSVHRIRRDADWDSINDPALRVFCVQPGDYRRAGRIELKTSGTPTRPRVIRYYDPLAPERAVHPVHMPDSKQARVLKFRFWGQAHWIVDGIAVLNSDPDTSLVNTTVNLRAHSRTRLGGSMCRPGPFPAIGAVLCTAQYHPLPPHTASRA